MAIVALQAGIHPGRVACTTVLLYCCTDVLPKPSPPPTQGLSHYLEHMLFMGSEKFPSENEYDDYIQKNGGSSNAFTELVSGGQCIHGLKVWHWVSEGDIPACMQQGPLRKVWNSHHRSRPPPPLRSPPTTTLRLRPMPFTAPSTASHSSSTPRSAWRGHWSARWLGWLARLGRGGGGARGGWGRRDWEEDIGHPYPPAAHPHTNISLPSPPPCPLQVLAVDSEFSGVLQMDGCRASQLLCHTVRGGRCKRV